MRKRRQNVLTNFRKKSRQREVSGLIQPAEEPGSGVSPMPLCGCTRNAEQLSGFLKGTACEEAELDDLGFVRMLLF
jgi:hypothetical protein